ncbi:cytochrome p450 [Colletotrichum incanum]|uniref:Cytochrome p450 n=1 Tax=Colletotrichum incanum TaxID=1573173 RepID=A0A166WG58_COLIC|nr:cytochrome p450 [Colletotrichum incanum]
MALKTCYSTAVVACLGIMILYITTSVIYNLYFHPLRNYPGPILMRATRWGFCYKLLKGSLPFDILELHKKYGDIIRVAPDELALCNVSAWKDIMGHCWIHSSNGREHSLLRRQLSHGFSDRSLREQEPLITKYVDLFIQRLYENGTDGEATDLMAWYNFTTFDIIGDLAFGEPFGCLQNSEYHPWVRAIFDSARLGIVFQIANHFPLLKKIILKLLATKSAQEARIKNFIRAKEKLQRRMELGKQGGRPDLIEGLLKQKDDLALSFEQLAANSNILIIGGSETTATLLAGATYYLLKNKVCLRKLVEEVRSTFNEEGEIDIMSVGKLTYMLACLDEAMRVYPPIAMGLPRMTPRGGATICGRFVPENTIVAIHQWAIHHHENYFKHPFEFHPERFLGDAEFVSDNKNAFQPFHIGARNCLGRNLAYVEMRLILARLIWNFDIELAEESQGWAERQKVFILWDKGPLKMHLKPARGGA